MRCSCPHGYIYGPYIKVYSTCTQLLSIVATGNDEGVVSVGSLFRQHVLTLCVASSAVHWLIIANYRYMHGNLKILITQATG